MYDKNNIFARILGGEIPAKVVYEDDYALAFHDVNPKAPVHVLVIPKGSYISFYDFTQNASAEEMVGLNKAVRRVIDDLNLARTGFRILSNHGVNGGQEVPHYHIHVFGGRKLGPMLCEDVS